MNKDLLREIYDAYAKEINLYLYSSAKIPHLLRI